MGHGLNNVFLENWLGFCRAFLHHREDFLHRFVPPDGLCPDRFYVLHLVPALLHLLHLGHLINAFGVNWLSGITDIAGPRL
jgi:hypothetical protein